MNVAANARPLRELTVLESRVLGVLIEKERTVPDTYPLTLNALGAGCNQKTSRNPVIDAGEADILAAIDGLKALSLVIESSGGRVMRYAQNFKRVLQIPTESVALLATLMLRGPQTAAELRTNSERLCRISDVSAVEAFLRELAARSAGALVIALARQPGSRENRWMHCLCGKAGLPATAAAAGAISAEEPGLGIDLPEVVAEVTALLARYETALLQADSAALDDLLWQSTRAAHLGADVRAQARPIRRTVLATRLTTFGRHCATSTIRFNRDGMPGEQLESQTWVRLAQGWRIVASHAGPPGAGDPQADDPQG
jgi:uncharacterized protein